MKKKLWTCIFFGQIFFIFSSDKIFSQDTLFSPITLKISEAQKRNYRYLGDILQTMPGIWIRDLGSTGQWASFRISGSGENQTLLLLDGRPMTDAWAGINDLNLVPVEMIEKVEIYPSVNPFGLSSAGGTVNLVTRDVPSNRPYTKILYRSGKDKFSDVDVTFGQRLTSRWEILSGVLLKKYGELLPEQTYESQQIRSKMSYSFSSDGRIQYSILHNKSDLDIPYSFPMPGDTLTLLSPHQKRLRYDHALLVGFNLWGTKNTFRFDHTSLSYEIRDADNGLKRTFPVQSSAIYFNQVFRLGRMSLKWGGYTIHRQLKDSEGTRLKDTIYQAFLRGNTIITGGFSGIPQLSLHTSTDGKLRILPSLTLAWRPSSLLHLWAGYSEAVRDPSLGERFGYPFTPTIPVTENQLRMNTISYKTIPNPDLKPEISRTAEAGIRWRREKIGIYFRGYLKTADDLIQGIFTEDWAQYTNQTKTDYKGIETSINAGPWHGLTGSLVVNLMDATDAESNNLLERPDIWGNGAISWQRSFFQDDLNVHICLVGRYWSGFWKQAGESPEESHLVYQDPGFSMDIKIFCTVIRNVTLSFAVDNVLGNEFAFVSTFLMPQQTTRIGITWELLD